MYYPSKYITILLYLLCSTWLNASPMQDRISTITAQQGVELKLDSGDTLRICPVRPDIFRVRLSKTGVFHESLMERYDIVRSTWPITPFTVERSDNAWRVKTDRAILVIQKSNGRLSLLNAQGTKLVENISPLASQLSGAELTGYRKRQTWLQNFFQYGKKESEARILGEPEQKKARKFEYIERVITDESLPRFGATFSMKDDERFYGLGSASVKRIQLRGHAYRNWVEYRKRKGFDKKTAPWEQTNGPVPFLMSTRGWGLFVNTTWLHYVDVGRYEADKLFFWGTGGDLDMYLMAGRDMPDLLDLYTEITGKPIVLPIWAYGHVFLAHRDINQFEMLRQARDFRHYGIPCDVYELTPGWMEVNYDYSHNKDWSKERFLVVWQPRNYTFVGAMDRMGFKTMLWLCCDDDLSMEEERQIAIAEGRPQDVPAKPRAWFDHLDQFVDDGIAGFMLDPAKVIDEELDRKYYNGRSELEMHLLNQVLLMKQMNLGYAKRGQRGFNHYCGKYTGIQRWGATTTGDNPLIPNALCWMLSQGLSGHMNTAADMVVVYRDDRPTWTYREGAGIHAGFLTPWVDRNNWAHSLEPWYLTEKLFGMYKDYAHLRYKLLPYIYSTAHHGAKTGMPIMRAMPLVYPKDPACADLTCQYMFGDAFLSAVFTESVYLPAGTWIDYWTGREYTGPTTVAMDLPDNRGGGLFVKAGAIIPTWPVMDYVGQKPVDTIGLHVYPDRESQFTLYEDDGETYAYKKGQLAETKIICSSTAAQIHLTIHSRNGRYKGMPKQRSYNIHIHTSKPRSITLNNKKLPQGQSGWHYDTEAQVIKFTTSELCDQKKPLNITITK